jgi:hypothetical protein
VAVVEEEAVAAEGAAEEVAVVAVVAVVAEEVAVVAGVQVAAPASCRPRSSPLRRRA